MRLQKISDGPVYVTIHPVARDVRRESNLSIENHLFPL